jgi:sterol desaturase/sphingolipid hydroxylase (fatty acid hydroxylase superfamily)
MRLPRAGPLFEALAIAAIVVLERVRRARPPVEPPLRHDLRNLAIGLSAAVPLLGLERPLALAIGRRCVRDRRGLLQRVRLPRALERALGVVLLDYTLYLWHVLTHRVPVLWRFHRAHHADRDLDASTALRFHPGEITISVLFRAAQVRLLGIAPETYRLWQDLLVLSIAFHHSNVHVPASIERWLCWLITTPRLHAIHHSTTVEARESNWSNGLAIWDVLHGTRRTSAPREGAIGLAGVPRPPSLRAALQMPFAPNGNFTAGDRYERPLLPLP